METQSEFLKNKENQALVLNRIIQMCRERDEWGSHGLFVKIGKKAKFSPAYVGQVLTGKKVLTDRFLFEISDYLGVTLAWLRGDEYSPFILKIAEATGAEPEITQKYGHVIGDMPIAEIKRYNWKELKKIFNKLDIKEQESVLDITKCLVAFNYKEHEKIIRSLMRHYYDLYGKHLEIHPPDIDNDGRFE